MKVGILESRSDTFINDVISNLGGVETEFLYFRHQQAPITSDYRVIVDRASFSDIYLKEIMKNLALTGVYVINNPFAATATNKLLDITIAHDLGISYPKTYVLPVAKPSEETEELIGEPVWEQIIDEIGLPCILKPFDGYAWTDVNTVNSLDELKKAYQTISPGQIMLVQQLIKYRDYYRAFCINKKDVLFVKWIPKPLSMGQYLYTDPKSVNNLIDRLIQFTIELNTRLDLDVNAVEWCLDENGHPWIIDAFNEVPEINKEALPQPYYNWIVEKFAGCILDKLDSDQRNRTAFLPAKDLNNAIFRIYPPMSLKP